MSIDATNAVWSRVILPPTNKLVMAFLADSLNGDTGLLNPSISRIARASGLSDCQARRIVHKLCADGLLSVVGNRYGGQPGDSVRYAIRFERLAALPEANPKKRDTTSADATPIARNRGGADAQDGSHPCAGGVAPMRETASAGASQTRKNRNRTGTEPAGQDSVDALPARNSDGIDYWLGPDR